jgi:polyhydroxyalkanoate synthesis regulator phasin
MKTKKSTEPKLRYKNYVMFVSDCCKDRFDLYEEFTREKTGEKAKKVIGYAYRFEEMIEKIVRVSVADKDVATLKDYVDEFKKELADIKNILK